jgi:predicted nucleotidyltransferase
MSKRINWDSAVQVFEIFPNLIAAWAFGSAQHGQVGPGSDVDIAVYFRINPSLDERADLRAELQKYFQVDDIDLVVLNGASPITRFAAISGRAIFCRDLNARAEFASLTAREHEDTMAFIQRGLDSYIPG